MDVTKRCGKSRLQELLAYFVRNPWFAANTSAAALYREIEQSKRTILLDELDATFRGDKEAAQAMRGILNAGAKFDGAVARVVGKGTEMKSARFSVFCPKCLAGIGELAETVADRSLIIRLQRKPREPKLPKLRERRFRPMGAHCQWSDRIFFELWGVDGVDRIG